MTRSRVCIAAIHKVAANALAHSILLVMCRRACAPPSWRPRATVAPRRPACVRRGRDAPRGRHTGTRAPHAPGGLCARLPGVPHGPAPPSSRHSGPAARFACGVWVRGWRGEGEGMSTGDMTSWPGKWEGGETRCRTRCISPVYVCGWPSRRDGMLDVGGQRRAHQRPNRGQRLPPPPSPLPGAYRVAWGFMRGRALHRDEHTEVPSCGPRLTSTVPTGDGAACRSKPSV